MTDIVDKLETPIESFISGFVIRPEICDELIEYFKKNINEAKPGCMWDTTINSKVVKKNYKDSLDLQIHPNNNKEPFKKYRTALQECFDNLVLRYEQLTGFSPVSINEPYNIQYYPVGGGFKQYHCERKSPRASNRVMVFMTYLNDVEDGGTEFQYLNIETPAKKGLTLLWPPEWTHTHRGVISNTKEKYIVTGWYHFIDEDKYEMLSETNYGNAIKKDLLKFKYMR